MRQFLLGANVAYPASIDNASPGMIGFTYLNDGVETIVSDGSIIKREGNIVLFRETDKGGNIVIPFFNNNFSYTKGVYSTPTTFSAKAYINYSANVGDNTIIIVKKGVKFNERNKWTITIYSPMTENFGKPFVEKFITQINSISENSGIKASYMEDGADCLIKLDAINAGEDYNIIFADNLSGTILDVVSRGIPSYGDAKYIQDLADKAAADAGFEYTYRDSSSYLYPNYPFNPLKSTDSTDEGFTIFNLRFAEVRDVKTKDEVVNQIVQIAFPTGAAAITTFETICKGLAGETTD